MKDCNIEPNDISHETIEFLFQQQMIALSRKAFLENNNLLEV